MFPPHLFALSAVAIVVDFPRRRVIFISHFGVVSAAGWKEVVCCCSLKLYAEGVFAKKQCISNCVRVRVRARVCLFFIDVKSRGTLFSHS